MANIPHEALLMSELTASLHENITSIKTILGVAKNKDVMLREFVVLGADACLVYVEGMAGGILINEMIMRPCRDFEPDEHDIRPEARAQYLMEHVLTAPEAQAENRVKKLIDDVLFGKTLLLIDGCADALIIETRMFEKRSVGKTNNESAVVGAQHGFVENLRTNITLVRHILRSPMLMSESHVVGKQIPTSLSILYLEGVADERVLAEVRRRVKGLDVDFVPDSGHLKQLIEERHFMMLPQTLETERPDRTAYLLAQGRIAILMDNSPDALIAPVSMFDFLQTADDSFMRWQYAMFNRLVRLMGFALSLLLPGLYVALTLYHTQLIPLELLTSIAEARLKVPFPVVIEILIMEFSYFLINEAGTRMPTQIGPALGIVGALILGQAAVAANIISPILIIIVAITGLGNYAVPNYGMSVCVQIMRLGLLVCGAMFGLYGILLGLFLYLCMFCSIRSFGLPYLAPFAPWRPHIGDEVLKLPLWKLDRLPFLAQGGSWLKRSPGGRKMRKWEGD